MAGKMRWGDSADIDDDDEFEVALPASQVRARSGALLCVCVDGFFFFFTRRGEGGGAFAVVSRGDDEQRRPARALTRRARETRESGTRRRLNLRRVFQNDSGRWIVGAGGDSAQSPAIAYPPRKTTVPLDPSSFLRESALVTFFLSLVYLVVYGFPVWADGARRGGVCEKVRLFFFFFSLAV